MTDSDVQMYDRALIKALTADNERLHAEIEARKTAVEKVYLEQCAEIERLRTQCGGHCRYWEGRWRDEAKENERLRAALDDCIHGRKDWTEKARRALEPKP
jgi:hypothetical protein